MGRATTGGLGKEPCGVPAVLESRGSEGSPFLSSPLYNISEDKITNGRDPHVWILLSRLLSPFAVVAGESVLCGFRFIACPSLPRGPSSSWVLEDLEMNDAEDLELCTRFEVPKTFPDHLLFCLSISQR